jgi:hypothetical protein
MNYSQWEEQSNVITNEQLTEIRARCGAATPGPWIAGQDEIFSTSQTSDGIQSVVLSRVSGRETYPSESDAEFIAHAPQDVPALLDYIYALKNEARELDANSAAKDREFKLDLEEANRRNVPMAVVSRKRFGGKHCPACDEYLAHCGMRFCMDCGQAIGWPLPSEEGKNGNDT